MTSKSRREARKKQILVQMAELQSRIKELRVLARRKRNAHRRVRLGVKICRLQMKYEEMVEMSQRLRKKKREKRTKPRTRALIRLMVQRMKTILTQGQGMIPNGLSKNMEKLKRQAHKTPQGWKLFKGIIKRLDMVVCGLMPMELALSTVPKKKSKPKALANVPMGPYRVLTALKKESLRSSLTPPRVVSKEPDRQIRSIETSLTALKAERRPRQTKQKSHQRIRKSSHNTRPKTDMPEDGTMKVKPGLTPGRIQRGSKKTSAPSKGLKKDNHPAISFDEITLSSREISFSGTKWRKRDAKSPRIRTIEIESDSKTNASALLGLASSSERSSNASNASVLSSTSDSKEGSAPKKPFNLLSRVRYLSYHIPIKEPRKETVKRPLDILGSIRNRITIGAASNISKANVNAALDYAVRDVPYQTNLLEANQQESMFRHDKQERQMRLNRGTSPRIRRTGRGSEEFVPELVPEPFPELNLAEAREEWQLYFAKLEKTPMELLLEQRRNERAALELQQQEAQLEEAQRQRLLLQKQAQPWRWRRRPKMVQDMYKLSDLFPQPKKTHEVCSECGMSVCCSENLIKPRPIIVTEAMIRKFKYLRVA